MSQRKVEEGGFRILTLEANVDREVIEFIRQYQVLASHLYWAKRLGIQPSDAVMQRVKEGIKSYWRWQIINEKDPIYLFKGIEKTPMPYSVVLKLPLVDALHENKGAFIRDGKLVLRLNKKVEITIPPRALEWLNKRLAEKPDRKTVRVFERGGKLVAQIVLHKKNEVVPPKNPLLVVVDLNSSHGIVVHYWDGKLIKTEKYRPPNRAGGWITVKRLMEIRDNLYNQGCITQAQINKYSAIIRRTLSGSVKSWVQQTVDRIVMRVRRIARRHGKDPLVLIDIPDDEGLRGTRLQRTLLSFAKHLENILSWYGIYWEEKRLYSTICLIAGGVSSG
ncbi:hypothetical protein [Vulcanisaeta souniana]|uniref:hypothetical protein n=1 Tax=Vulcanisaeta souniana TaxID=164452 RepID=UPI0006D0DF20|nr:hypothetical protein [Vulcanisaeta souniana]